MHAPTIINGVIKLSPTIILCSFAVWLVGSFVALGEENVTISIFASYYYLSSKSKGIICCSLVDSAASNKFLSSEKVINKRLKTNLSGSSY